MSLVNWEQVKELSLSSAILPLLTFTILTLFLTRLVSRIASGFGNGSKHASRLPPPGPWRLPVIGNLHQMVSILPHRRLHDLARKHGPDLMHLQLGEVSHVVISSPRAAQEVMKTHDLVFASRPSLLGADIVVYGGSDLAFTPYNEAYKHLRKVCMREVLGAGRVRYFRPIREAEVANLIHRLSQKAALEEAVDVSKEVVWVSSRVTSRTALGKAMEEDDGFLKMVADVSDALGGFGVSDLFPSLKFLPAVTGLTAKLRRMHRDLDSMLDELIDEHKERRAVAARGGARAPEGGDDVTTDDHGNDLVDVLLDLQESGTLQFDLTMKNIKAVTVEVFLAGMETSSTAMDWTMAEMMKDQRVLRKAQEEVRRVYREKGGHVDESSLQQLEYLDSVIKESLRLHPALPLLLPRESGEHVKVCGYDIPAKTKVIINGWAIGRDPHHWMEPDKFFPERFLDSSIDYKGNNFEFIPFGAGRRMCPGMLYATAVVKLTLANMLYHFDWKLPEGLEAENLDLSEAFGLSVRRKCSLFLVPVAYDAMDA